MARKLSPAITLAPNAVAFAARNRSAEASTSLAAADGFFRETKVTNIGSCSGRRSAPSNLQLLGHRELHLHRFYSASSNKTFRNRDAGSGRDQKVDATSQKHLGLITKLIIGGASDMKSKLDKINARLSVSSIMQILRTINSRKVSALRFYRWIQISQPDLSCNPDICSLLIDNCGRLENHETMHLLLSEFSSNGVCLTKRAFTFLTVLVSATTSVKDSISKVVDVLNQVGGSCRGSGVFALIEMFSQMGSFEMAKHVIQITERKASYYNILVREKCRKGHSQEVRVLIEEMRQVGCGVTSSTYNYFISSLCRNDKLGEAVTVVEEMKGTDCPPDSLTFEILIYYFSRMGKLNSALEFLDRMTSMGIEPRSNTHAAFIKGYFFSEQQEEAYKYVVSSPVSFSSNIMYCLLASLHKKKGDISIAQKILVEMMEKGLKPVVSVYWSVLKHLEKTGDAHLAEDLKSRFNGLREPLGVKAD